MSKQLPYFQFEPAEYLASDISICSLEAQGLFTLIISFYWQKDCTLNKDKFLKRHNHPKEFQELVEEGIFKVDNNGFIKIKFLDIQHHFISKRKEINSENGKKGAIKRIENQSVNKPGLSDTSSQAQATPKHIDKIREDDIREDNNTSPAEAEECENSPIKNQSSPQEEKKEKSSAKKESLDWDGLLAYINKNTGRNFKVINKAVRSKYKARLRDGYTKDDIISVITNAPKTEFHKENNCQYCTPEYFSRADIIDKYSEVTKNDSETTVALKMNT